MTRYPTFLSLALLALATAALGISGWSLAGGPADALGDGGLAAAHVAPQALPEWELVEDLRIGREEGTGPDVFGPITDLRVDAGGRVYVLGRLMGEVRVFDGRGAFLRRFGRDSTAGPRLRQPVGMAVRGSEVWVLDPARGTFSVWDTAGRHVREVERPLRGFVTPWQGQFDSGGRLIDPTVLGGSAGPTAALVRASAGATVQPRDTFLLPELSVPQWELSQGEGRVLRVPVPFSPRLAWAVDAERGLIWIGSTERYQIAQRRFAGDTVRLLRRDIPAVPVTAADRARALADLRWFTDRGGRVDTTDIPAHKEAFLGLTVGSDGKLWVRRQDPDGGTRFDVFDRTGRPLATARSAVEFALHPPLRITGEHVYGVMTGPVAEPYIVRARIRRARG